MSIPDAATTRGNTARLEVSPKPRSTPTTTTSATTPPNPIRSCSERDRDHEPGAGDVGGDADPARRRAGRSAGRRTRRRARTAAARRTRPRRSWRRCRWWPARTRAGRGRHPGADHRDGLGDQQRDERAPASPWASPSDGNGMICELHGDLLGAVGCGSAVVVAAGSGRAARKRRSCSSAASAWVSRSRQSLSVADSCHCWSRPANSPRQRSTRSAYWAATARR